MKHYLVTQWNCDLYDLDWLKQRQTIFERFTLPSVQAQTNKNFEWVLVSDSRTPKEFKKILNSYGAFVIYHDFENHKWMTGPINPNETPIDKAVRLETIGDIVAGFIGKQDTDYVITTRLDNDDCIASDYIENIQTQAKRLWNQGEREYWVSWSRGLKWADGNVYPHASKWNSFVSFVEPAGNLKTAYQCCHSLIGDSGYPIHLFRVGFAAPWLEVIHGGNALNRRKRGRGERPASIEQGRFNFKND